MHCAAFAIRTAIELQCSLMTFWEKNDYVFYLHAILVWFLFIERREGVDTALLAIDKHSL